MSQHSSGWHCAMSALRSRLEELTVECERVEAEGEQLRTERDNSQMELRELRARYGGTGEHYEPVSQYSESPVMLQGRSDDANGEARNTVFNMRPMDESRSEAPSTSDVQLMSISDDCSPLTTGEILNSDQLSSEQEPVKTRLMQVSAPGLLDRDLPRVWGSSPAKAKTLARSRLRAQQSLEAITRRDSTFSVVSPVEAPDSMTHTPTHSYDVSSVFAVGGCDDKNRHSPNFERTMSKSWDRKTWVAWGSTPPGNDTIDEDIEANLTRSSADMLDGFRSSTAAAMEERCQSQSQHRLLTRSKTVGFGDNLDKGNAVVRVVSEFQKMNKRSVNHPGHEQQLRTAHVSMKDWTLGTSQGQWLVLGVIGALLVNFGALLWKVFCGNDDYDTSWRTSFWISWCLFIDPGTQTGFPPSDPWHVHLIVLLLSSCGFLFNLSFLGMIVEIVKSSLARWRKERYRIVRTGHILILGWTDKTLFLLTETLEKAVQQGTKIVILAERDEIEMKQDIRSHFFNKEELSRHVIGRRGCPFEVDDLIRVSAGSARDIIVLDKHGSNSDLEIVRVMVALAALPEEISGKVTSEVRKMEAAPVIEAVMRGAVGVRARGAVVRVLGFMSMRPMIADCFINLCSFREAEEITVRHAPALAGKSFGELCYIFKRATLIGLKRQGLEVILAPPDDIVLDDSDSLVLIGHDPKRLRHEVDASAATFMSRAGRTMRKVFRRERERQEVEEAHTQAHIAIIEAMNGIASASHLTLVVIGWPVDFIDVLMVLDKIVSVPTLIHVLSEKPVLTRQTSLAGTPLTHIKLVHHVGERTSVRKLASLPLREAYTVIILAEDVHNCGSFSGASTDPPANTGLESSDESAADSAITRDSMCLAVMVTVQGILEGRFGHPRVRGTHGRIICEVLDPRTEQLLARNKALQQAATFFRSNALEAGMFARAATEPISYSALMLLLQPGNPSGELTAVPCLQLLHGRRRSASNMDQDDDVVGEADGLSFWELHQKVRACNGGILVGFWRYPILCCSGHLDEHREGRAMLSPLINRRKKLQWRAGDWLLIIARRGAQKTCQLSDPGTRETKVGQLVRGVTDWGLVRSLSEVSEESESHWESQ